MNAHHLKNTVTELIQSHHQQEDIAEEVVPNVTEYANSSSQEISERIEALEEEWDADSLIQAEVTLLAGLGFILGMFVNKKWWTLTGLTLPFFLNRKFGKWLSPKQWHYKAGIRPRRSIDAEIYALKALRGDYSTTQKGNPNPKKTA